MITRRSASAAAATASRISTPATMNIARTSRAPASSASRASSRIASSRRSCRATAVRTLSNASRPAAAGGGVDARAPRVDGRARVARAPVRRRVGDRRQLEPRGREPRVALELGERLDRLALGGAAHLVRPQEGLVAGEHEAAHAGLLVEQRGREALRGEVGGADAVDQERAPVVEPLERDQPGHDPDHRDQHEQPDDQAEPLRDREAAPADHDRRRAISTRATSSASGPPLRSSARSTTSRISSSGSGSVPASAAATTSASPSSPSRSLPPADAPVGHAVGVEQQRPRVRERDLERRPGGVVSTPSGGPGRRRGERGGRPARRAAAAADAPRAARSRARATGRARPCRAS